MDLADCYRLLGLTYGASLVEVKASYRRLARRYHPDVNPGDKLAHEKFIRLTEVYKFLLSVIEQPVGSAAVSSAPQTVTTTSTPPEAGGAQHAPSKTKVTRFARAIALVEGLAQRIPYDPEIRQWQAIAYSSWGRQLVNEGQLDKARNYLKKALRTDPHNRSLWAEVERDFRRIEHML